MESGAPTTGLYVSATDPSVQSTYNTVVAQAGCSSASNKLECLRSISFSILYSALESTTFALSAFFPVIDGGFISQSPSKQLINGQYIKIPTIQGHNDDEGALFSLNTNSSSDSETRSFITCKPQYNTEIASWPFFTSSQVDQLMADYPNIPSEGVPYGRFDNQTFPDYGTQWRRVASIEGDALFIGPCRLFSNVSSFSGGQTLYRYRLNLTAPGLPAMLGATHGDDVPYVWNTPSLRTDAATSRTIDFVSRAWVSFVVDLTPNHHGVQNIPTWNPYSTSSSGQNFVIALDNFSTELDTFRVQGIKVINNAVLQL
jgi:acetylcholinesterase